MISQADGSRNRMLWIGTLMEETKPVVMEKYEL